MKQSELIFYDSKKRRKFYFRTAAILLFSTFLWGTTNMAISIATVSPFENDYNMDDYNMAEKDKKLALTFDDGPHDVYTDLIIRLLEKNDVNATFFFVGENLILHREAAKKAFDAGIEIGNHSFTHSYDIHKDQRRIGWELNATNKLIEEITGHSALLYRPPYLLNIGSDPTIYAESEEDPLIWAAQNGYIPVGSDIDPKDWLAKSSQEVIDNFRGRVESGGNIVLLHDNDGAATMHTIAALETLIPEYKEKGYEFVTVSELFGLGKEQVMPPLAAKKTTDFFDGFALKIVSSAVPIAFSVMGIVIILVFARLFILLFLFIIDRKNKSDAEYAYVGIVSVLVPAYNEEENIESTIDSLIKNDYPHKEIIVIDDGSKDRTAEIARNFAARYPETVRVYSIPNGGKAGALNYGIQKAAGKIIVAVDGDSIFRKNAISLLVRHFRDKKVGAVAGKISAINSKNLLDLMQKVEYTAGQNVEKKALAVLGAVNIVPGPVGAWRKKYVKRAGGYKTDTLVEDQDLTLSIHLLGKKVIYEPAAIAYTETPHTIRNFVKQRFRWNFGTMQCLWKYKSNFLRLKPFGIGWVILPNILVYNMLVPMVYPVVDLIALVSLFSDSWKLVLASYFAFTIFDMLYVVIALFWEGKDYRLIWLVPLQRIFYRQLMYIIAFKSLFKAIEGTAAFWNKFERQGTIKKFYNELLIKENARTEINTPAR